MKMILLLFYSKEKITTALFLVLNLLSEVDSKNNFANIAYLRDFFERIFESCCKINNILLKHQIIIFISNYTTRFYESDTDVFENIIFI